MTGTHLRARLGDSTQVVDEVGLGHTDTGIPDAENFVLFLRGYPDVKLLLGLESGGVGQRSITDFVQGIGAIGDQFAQENLLVGVEGV